jgi:hypothetical protein
MWILDSSEILRHVVCYKSTAVLEEPLSPILILCVTSYSY